MIGINGQFPGPTIRAKAGDTIVVELKNALHTEGVVIHWHGIRQVLSLSLSAIASSLSRYGSLSELWVFSNFSWERRGQTGRRRSRSAPSTLKRRSFTASRSTRWVSRFPASLGHSCSSIDMQNWLLQAGTYFYLGHYGMQRAAGLYGSLIVDVADGEKEPFHYDSEHSLLLSNWYHQDINTQSVGLSSNLSHHSLSLVILSLSRG